MKNTSYEERKKCCLKELLGQTPSDGDPDRIYHYHSLSDYKNGDLGWKFGQTSGTEPTHSNDNISAVFLETIRDGAIQEPFLVALGFISTAYSASDIERTTVVHEIGHVFGCSDGEGGIMNSGVEDPALNFAPVSINKIRSLGYIGVP